MKFTVVSLLALAACIAYRSVNAQCKSASAAFSATEIATYNTNCTGAGCVEVLAYDKKTKLVAVVLSTNSAVVILNLTDPYKPVQIANITMGALNGEMGYGAPNSVAAYNGYIAVAMDAQIKTNPGYVRLYSLDGFMKVGEAVVAAMPDMIIFSADGKKLYLACEGEPSTQEISGSDPNVGANPSGTFDILDVTWNGTTGFPTITGNKSLDFQTYIDSLTDTQYTNLLAGGMKIDPRVNKSRAAVDIEPEYIALSDDGKTAYLTLQENSAIAVIDLVKEAIVDIRPLGARSLNRSVADLSDRPVNVSLTTWTNVNLWYQPDTIDFKTIGGVGYLFTANEGDSKEEKRRVAAVGGTNGSNFDAQAFPNAQALMADASLGRFGMDPLSGISDGYNTSKAWNAQGPYNKIYGYGARSFSIIRASDGLVVFDSRSKMEELIAANPIANKCFNCDRNANAADSRSDDAGIEPEGIATVQLGECSYAIIGLERQSGLMIFDVTNPSNATYVDYIVNRNFTTNSTIAANIGHLAPEMVKIISANDSPIPGRPLMLVTNEFSGNVIVYQLPGSTTPIEPPAKAPLMFGCQLKGASIVPTPVITKAVGSVSVEWHNQSYAVGSFYVASITNAFMAHIHVGNSSVNGPVISPAFNPSVGDAPQFINGSFSTSWVFNPSVNNVTGALTTRNAYFVVHTLKNQAGEIRCSFKAMPPKKISGN